MELEETPEYIAILFKVISIDAVNVSLTAIGILEGTLRDTTFCNSIDEYYFPFNLDYYYGEFCYGFPIAVDDLKERLNISNDKQAKRIYFDMLEGINFLQHYTCNSKEVEKHNTYTLVFDENTKRYQTIKIEDSMETLFDLPKDLCEFKPSSEVDLYDDTEDSEEFLEEPPAIDSYIMKNIIELNDFICKMIESKNKETKIRKVLPIITSFLDEYIKKEDDLYSKLSLDELKQVILKIKKINMPNETSIIPQNNYQRILEKLRERMVFKIANSSLSEYEIKEYSECFESVYQLESQTNKSFLYQYYTKIDVLRRLYRSYCNSTYSEEELMKIKTIFQQSHPMFLYLLDEHPNQVMDQDYIQERNEMVYQESKTLINKLRMLPNNEYYKMYFKNLISFLDEHSIKNLSLYLQQLKTVKIKPGDKMIADLLINIEKDKNSSELGNQKIKSNNNLSTKKG